MLNKLGKKYDEEFKEIEEECLRLTDYGVNIRYPYPMDLDENDMKLAIKDSDKIFNFVLKKYNFLKSKNDSES